MHKQQFRTLKYITTYDKRRFSAYFLDRTYHSLCLISRLQVFFQIIPVDSYKNTYVYVINDSVQSSSKAISYMCVLL